MPSLEQVETYNPNQFCSALSTLRQLTPENKPSFYAHLEQKTLEYSVAKGIIFSDILYGKRGFFEENPDVHSVIFVNGRLEAKNKTEKELCARLDDFLDERQVLPIYFIRPNEPKQEDVYWSLFGGWPMKAPAPLEPQEVKSAYSQFC